MADPSDPATQHSACLQEIADALGISVNWFYEEKAPPFTTEAFQIIRLYTAITDVQGRQRVLNFARSEAERCQSHDDPGKQNY